MEFNGLNHVAFDMNPATEIIEMQHQTMAVNSPPVFSGPNVIVAQPQEEKLTERWDRVESNFRLNGEGQARRPIPVNTQDWISTPRSQLSALSGSHFLGNVEQLEVQQIVDLSTLLGRPGKGSQFRVKVPQAETLFLAVEDTTGKRQNGFIRSKFSRGDYTLNIFDQCGETVFTMRINSTWIFCPNQMRILTVTSSKYIGTVEENFSIVGPNFTVYDANRNPLCNIFGPNVCGCCMYKEAAFQVISIDGTYQMASLMHQWDNTLHDYTFLITFPADTDIKLKSLLLGAVFLLEHMFFREVTRTSA